MAHVGRVHARVCHVEARAGRVSSFLASTSFRVNPLQIFSSLFVVAMTDDESHSSSPSQVQSVELCVVR